MHASILLITLALCLAVNATPSGYGHHGYLGRFGDRDTSLFDNGGEYPELNNKITPKPNQTAKPNQAAKPNQTVNPQEMQDKAASSPPRSNYESPLNFDRRGRPLRNSRLNY